MLFISPSGILSLACKWSCSRVGKELLAPGHEKIWFPEGGEGAEVVYKVLLEGPQWRLQGWEPFISSFLCVHVCSAFLLSWRGFGFKVWTATRILGESWRNLPTKCGKALKRCWAQHERRHLVRANSHPCWREGALQKTPAWSVWRQNFKMSSEGGTVSSEHLQAWWVGWLHHGWVGKSRMEGFKGALRAVIKAGTKTEAAELEWNHLGSSFHRLHKGETLNR